MEQRPVAFGGAREPRDQLLHTHVPLLPDQQAAVRLLPFGEQAGAVSRVGHTAQSVLISAAVRKLEGAASPELNADAGCRADSSHEGGVEAEALEHQVAQ